MTPDILTTPERISLDGKTFVPAEQVPISEWPCVMSERPQPMLTVKDDDLFLVTDTLGNISASSLNDGHSLRSNSKLSIQNSKLRTP